MPRLLVPILIAFLSAGAGCRGESPPDPAERGREILSRSPDEATARARWREDPANWSLGLRHELAGATPRRPIVVSTTRELVTGGVARCLPGGADGAAVFYRTAVDDPDGSRPMAVFHWRDFEDAASGHHRVRALVAAAGGDADGLWAAVADDPSLAEACVELRGHRRPCGAS